MSLQQVCSVLYKQHFLDLFGHLQSIHFWHVYVCEYELVLQRLSVHPLHYHVYGFLARISHIAFDLEELLNHHFQGVNVKSIVVYYENFSRIIAKPRCTPIIHGVWSKGLGLTSDQLAVRSVPPLLLLRWLSLPNVIPAKGMIVCRLSVIRPLLKHDRVFCLLEQSVHQRNATLMCGTGLARKGVASLVSIGVWGWYHIVHGLMIAPEKLPQLEVELVVVDVLRGRHFVVQVFQVDVHRVRVRRDRVSTLEEAATRGRAHAIQRTGALHKEVVCLNQRDLVWVDQGQLYSHRETWSLSKGAVLFYVTPLEVQIFIQIMVVVLNFQESSQLFNNHLWYCEAKSNTILINIIFEV